jgi:hypothetical protein
MTRTILCLTITLLFVASSEAQRRRSVSKAPTSPSTTTPAPPRVTLDQAQHAIPDVLTRIYRALEQGNIDSARPLVSAEVANSAEKLDRLCKPFNYRAHYIEGIVERPSSVFEARIHLLSKPLDESIYVLLFRVRQGGFYLADITDPTDNWIEPEKEMAKDLARKFIFAARAGREDVLKDLVSPGLNIKPFLIGPCWKAYFEHINQLEPSFVDVKSRQGLKFLVTMNPDACNAKAYFLIDQIDGKYKIVAADPHGQYYICFGLNDWAGVACTSELFDYKAEDLNLEEYTLRRFGVSPG